MRDIEWSDVKVILEDIGLRCGPRASNAAFSRIRKFFRWLHEESDRGDGLPPSPLYWRRPLFPENDGRERVLTDAELSELWAAADVLGYPYGAIFKLLAVLGQRRSEVAGMRWVDVDLQRAIWRMPARSTKNNQPHILPLPRLALQILKASPRIKGSPFVFPSARDVTKPLTGFSAMKRELDRLSGVADWTLHDLRRTQATVFPGLGVDELVVERIHNHTLPHAFGSSSMKIYNRNKYLPQMLSALECYATYIGTHVQTQKTESRRNKLPRYHVAEIG